MIGKTFLLTATALLVLCPQPAMAQIAVGHTQVISSDAPTDPHGESFFAVNPKNSNDQIAASCRISGGDAGMGVSGYVTHDGGKTWSRIKLPGQMKHTWDVITYFDHQGNGYFASNDRNGLWIIRSSDAGRTWSEPALVLGIKGFDRQQMAFDTTGRYAGRIYAGATGSAIALDGKDRSTHAIAFSTDGGKTFGQPRLITSTDSESNFAMLNILVTPDGTVVAPFWTMKHDADFGTLFEPGSADKEVVTTEQLRVAISGDGGNTYSVTPPVEKSSWTFKRSDSFKRQLIQGNGFAAIDLSDGPYRGRVYVVWVEHNSDRHDVRVIHSSDNGKTWSKPISAGDDKGPVADANPTIAVNNHGVVGVSWNDRRNQKDDCYDLYFTASLDGGDSFLPNVTTGQKPTCPLAPGNWKPDAHVSAYPKTEEGSSVEGQGLNVLMISTRFPGGGDTQGLDSDNAGVFHAAWIDGSSGVMQLARTSFTVPGKVQQATVVAKGHDVSTQVKLIASDCGFEWKQNVFACRMHLENKSPLPVTGPFTVELQNMVVNLVGFHAQNQDNDKETIGAVWNFKSQQLAPNGSSEERKFQWQFTEIPKEPQYPFMMFRVTSNAVTPSVTAGGH